ncbi:MAG TPA: RluA family pseudouridine synthase [Vicinamibacteria bacterium]|nr:RluA family pseudouridine synthase [Vicinamibacteria bacterium]
MDAIAWLHRDDDVVAVDKPPGEPVIAARGEPKDACLHRRAEAALGARLFVVHRIDRDTSGVVLFARTAEAHRLLNRAFEARGVSKAYVAFAAGLLEPARGQIDIALHSARRGKSRPAEPGEPGRQQACTDYAVERAWRLGAVAVSRIVLRPVTGRHHQLRVHLRARGAPILFDRLYGRGLHPALDEAPCRRLALHAQRIEAPRPGGGRLTIEAPLPDDLQGLEAWLSTRGDPARV